MTDRVRFITDRLAATCPDCAYQAAIEQPTPDQAKRLIRSARHHARRTGHVVVLQRIQLDTVRA